MTVRDVIRICRLAGVFLPGVVVPFRRRVHMRVALVADGPVVVPERHALPGRDGRQGLQWHGKRDQHCNERAHELQQHVGILPERFDAQAV
jgi:hypothetical protein